MKMLFFLRNLFLFLLVFTSFSLHSQTVKSAMMNNNYRDVFSIIKDGNTVAWYDYTATSTLTKDASNFVSIWSDKLGSGRNLKQTTSGKKPVLNSEGLYFDGNDDFLKTDPFEYNQPASIYLVVKYHSWSPGDYIIDGYTSGTAGIAGFTAQPTMSLLSGGQRMTNDGLTLNQFGIIRICLNSTNSKFYFNNVAQNNPGIDLGSNGLGGITLGSYGTNTASGVITVKEIICRKKADKLEDEKLIYKYLATKYGYSTPKKILYAYPNSSDAIDNGTNVFAGSVNNINAIQRAINTVPANDIYHEYEIHCFGEFKTTSFADASSINGEYRSFVALFNKYNIRLVGHNNAKISCVFPNTGSPVDYQYLHPIFFNAIDCSISNFIIEGQNIRYPLHIESTLNLNSKLKFTNCTFIHKGNYGDATSWLSWSSFGVGTTYNMELIFNGCMFKSVNHAGFGGHDSNINSNTTLRFTNCLFSSENSNGEYSITWNLMGKPNSTCHFELNNNVFECKKIKIFDMTSADYFATFSGSGNSKFLFETDFLNFNYPALSDVLYTKTNTGNLTISAYDAVDTNGTLATGQIEGISLETVTPGSSYKMIKNTIILLTKLNIKSGESFSNGDFVTAENGKLIKTTNPSTAKIINTSSGLCLEIL